MKVEIIASDVQEFFVIEVALSLHIVEKGVPMVPDEVLHVSVRKYPFGLKYHLEDFHVALSDCNLYYRFIGCAIW